MNWLGLLGLDKRIARYRALAADVADAAEDRVELLAIEWEDEKLRLQRVIVLGVLAAIVGIVALTVLSGAVIVHFWDSGSRHVVAWVVAIAWLLLWAGVIFALGRANQGGRHAFAQTRQEFKRDWADMKERL